MLAELRDVRQCKRCGKVTGDIQATHSKVKVHVEKTAVLMHDNPAGKDRGYTLGGKLIRGEIVEKPSQGAGYWEVFPEHLCGVEKEDD